MSEPMIHRRSLPDSLRYLAQKLDGPLSDAERAGIALTLNSLADEAEQPGPLAEVFESLDRVLTSSSRDWGEYWADAWLYGVLTGWDCETPHEHDDVCGDGGAMRELTQKHGWDDEAVSRLRRYRAAVRAASAGLVRPDEETT